MEGVIALFIGVVILTVAVSFENTGEKQSMVTGFESEIASALHHQCPPDQCELVSCSGNTKLGTPVLSCFVKTTAIIDTSAAEAMTKASDELAANNLNVTFTWP